MNASKKRLKESYPAAWRWISLGRRIPGWLTDDEANALFEMAQALSARAGAVIVELGSWQGKSSVLLGAGLGGKTDGRVYCVDPFGEDENPEYQALYYAASIERMDLTLEDTFRRNVRRCGLSGTVRAVRAYSYDAVKAWEDPIDILFIDANHEYASVRRDFVLWSPFVKVGGIVALHDVSPAWPGPSRVMAEELQPPCYGDIRQVDSLTWAVKKSNDAARGLDSCAQAAVTIPKSDFDARQREIARQRTEIDQLKAAIADNETALRDLEAEIRRIEGQIGSSLKALEDLRSSRSWRVTAPLRALVDLACATMGGVRRTRSHPPAALP
jgi:predicted O-methyltransferase YrrM